MSKHLAELCTLLVDGSYGELPARIISTLLVHGRLALLPLSHLSDLGPRYVRNGLAVLIQQNLVYYFTSEEGLTVYDANLRSAYELVRSGKATQLIEERYGVQAAELVSVIQDRGFAEASELLSFATQPSILGAGSHVNGHALTNGASRSKTPHPNKTSLLDKRLEVCQQLFTSKHIVKLTQDDLLSASDFNDKIEKQVKTEKYGGEIKGTKLMAEFKKDVLKKKREALNSNTATRMLLEDAAKTIRDGQSLRKNRRRADSAELDEDQVDSGEPERGNKKRKVDNEKAHKVNTKESKALAADKSDPSLSSQPPTISEEPSLPTFRLNSDKFNVSFRSQRLVDLSARLLGDSTSQVYSAILRRLEHNIPRCHDEYSDSKKTENDNEEGDDVGYESDDEPAVTATSMEVEKSLDVSIDLQVGVAPEKQAKVRVEVNGELTEDGNDTETKVNGDAAHSGTSEAMINRQRRVGLVEQHLRLLSEHSCKFLTKVSTRGQGTWSVDFKTLSHTLIQHEIDTLVSARFGPIATRIIRILHTKGKLDEKQLGSIGLIRQKDLRRVLTLMQEAGYVDTQEVPRDNTRQPSRTIYLWFYDQDRCRKLVLNDTYKAMSRLLQRARVEKENVQSVMDKAERTDVKGQEDRYLSKVEKDALADWLDKEQKLLVQLSRQDDLIAILRDFLPMGL